MHQRASLKSKSAGPDRESETPKVSPELHALLKAVVERPDEWLKTPNPQFGGRRPVDLVGTDEEEKIFDLLHAVEHGLF